MDMEISDIDTLVVAKPCRKCGTVTRRGVQYGVAGWVAECEGCEDPPITLTPDLAAAIATIDAHSKTGEETARTLSAQRGLPIEHAYDAVEMWAIQRDEQTLVAARARDARTV